jgi:L-histidine N-alpha-methyltransferase
MITYPQTVDLGCVSTLDTREMLIQEVQRGLLARPRSLAPWMFYDAIGSGIFERITELPEYYPTRTERHILTQCSTDIIDAACPDQSKALRIVELGAGTASKTSILLRAAVRAQLQVLFAPVDVSPDALSVACEAIGSALPDIATAPIVANYITHPPQLEPFSGVTMGLCIGSSIGNFEPLEARTVLLNLKSQLRRGDMLLLGVDRVKDEQTMLAAYDDEDGVTAEFNLNMLHRLNRELSADFNPRGFRHRVRWNLARSRIEMHLESSCNQRVRIADAQVDVHFAKGETIHTESSHKFTDGSIDSLLKDAGFEVMQTWTDECGWYSVTLASIQ